MTNTLSTKRPRRMAREPQSDANAEPNSRAEAAPLSQTKSVPPKKGPSKTAKVITLLLRSGGATLDELIEATCWLPHTTRAALTGLRKKGYPIERTKLDGISRYAVVETATQ